MMRDIRELYDRDGISGVLGLAIFFWWTLQCEYQIVRHGVRALRALLA